VRAIWAASRPLPVDAEFPLFFIYTSGSTGKPKGFVHVQLWSEYESSSRQLRKRLVENGTAFII
jgi:acyl-coenzyme A synthetase/AMP-(fatty) acid ligase